MWWEQWQQNHRKWLWITWTIFCFSYTSTAMWCSAWRALEGEDSEGKDKGLVRCREMWQGTLCSHWSTTVSEQDSAGTGLSVYALPSFCSKPHLPTSQWWMRQKERGWQSVLHTELWVSLCFPWSLLHSQLPALCRIEGLDDFLHIFCSAHLPCLLHEPVELGDRDLAWNALSLTSTGIALALPQKNPLTQSPA